MSQAPRHSAHTATVVYGDIYEAPIPVNSHELPIPVGTQEIRITDDYTARLVTLDGQKVVIPDNGEKEPATLHDIPLPSSAAPQVAAPSSVAETICGVRRRVFYIVLAVAAVVFLGVAAGFAGGFVARRNADDAGTVTATATPSDAPTSSGVSSAAPSSPAASSPAPAVASLILNNSQLAAALWENKTEPRWSYVLHQDPLGSLIFSIWNDISSMWTSVNVSDRLLRNGDRVLPRLGTPLAITTGESFHIALFYIDLYNNVRALITFDRSYQSWRLGTLYDRDQAILASPESQLDVCWLVCGESCRGSKDGDSQIRFFFEDTRGDLQAYYGNPWVPSANFNQNGRPGSALASTAYRSDSGSMDMKLFFDTGEKLGMMSWTNDTSWYFDEAFSGPTWPTFQGQKMATMSFSVTGTSSEPSWAILVVQLERNGSLTATYWDPRNQRWTFGVPVRLVGELQLEPAFSAIAMNMDRRFYGIANGSILEYRVTSSDFTQFEFTSSVPLLGASSA
ncbi:hypothetical protein MFIFM68171_06510 [Madurella fahalii]|uniref:Fucose-specific lectin n=1 Tax=Madurella fahalii TaxID=1157608 RepID=A0ABQ0GF29_9PEZI